MISENPWFSTANLMAVFLNLIVLLLDKYPINQRISDDSEICNMLFTAILISEFLIKVAAYGLDNYLRASYYNQYDCCVVLLSTIDVLTANIFFSNQMDVNSKGITVLRAFRILRIFKLARFWRYF